MSELAEKIAEETILSGGSGGQDYKKDFRNLAEIDKTNMELPYSLTTYWESSNTDLDIGETKAYRLQAYLEGAASETRDRYFVRAMCHAWNYISSGYYEIFRQKDTAIIVDVYYILNSVTYPLLTRIFTWLTHRSFTWNNGQPFIVLNIEPSQITKIPAGAQFWMKMTNRTSTKLAALYPFVQFMEIT